MEVDRLTKVRNEIREMLKKRWTERDILNRVYQDHKHLYDLTNMDVRDTIKMKSMSMDTDISANIQRDYIDALLDGYVEVSRKPVLSLIEMNGIIRFIEYTMEYDIHNLDKLPYKVGRMLMCQAGKKYGEKQETGIDVVNQRNTRLSGIIV